MHLKCIAKIRNCERAIHTHRYVTIRIDTIKRKKVHNGVGSVVHLSYSIVMTTVFN